MLRRHFTRLVGAGAIASALPILGTPARAADPLKVGFIYLGPVGDFGWTYQHDIARKAAVEHFGDAIKTTYVENVAEGPDSEKVLNDLANQGHKLIFATSFGYMNYVLNSAKKHPAVFYEHATGYKRSANVSDYNIRFYQARYVQGIIAGKLSKAGLAGYVGSVPVPEVVQGINAFMLGMQSVNPKARMKFVLINSWYDPPKEGDAAKALIDQGCDIITQHTDSPAPLQAAASRGIKAFGQSTDMSKFANGTQLTRQHRCLGAILHQAHSGRVVRHLEKHRHLGRLRQRHAGHVTVHQYAGRRRGAGDIHRRRHHLRQEQGLCRADHGPDRRHEGSGGNHDGRWRAGGHAVAGPGCGWQADLNRYSCRAA